MATAKSGDCVVHLSSRAARGLLAAAAAYALGGCSSVDSFLSGDKIDYKSQASKTAALDVPPDLTQLARDSRYQPQSGVVSASGMATNTAAAAAAPSSIAVNSLGDMRIERDGNQRWLITTLTPEQLWPQLRTFWTERGFNLVVDDAQNGVMETDWAENRSRIPQDGVRRLLGGILDRVYDTGERDRYRTRVERVAGGSEVSIAHRGAEEFYQGQTKEVTSWRLRPTDPQLEAEMLVRLMTKLGAKEETARTQVANAPAAPARARVLSGQPGAALEFDESFDRAWRRIGLALDRTGFTVEDRDRSGGLYFVRYVDPKLAGREEPGFFSKLFGLDDKNAANLQRYRIALKRAGEKTQVVVQNSQGSPEAGETGQRIVTLLVDELK
ncbi:MAG: outer membrane protein assembly factor BamC [Burkholderiaceae bacterium]|nr:outer membrane protein assembly factor BamC [Burkholderiaceae bacterium]